MNYKIKITAENQAIVKRIANENEMNPNDLLFILFKPFYKNENCIFTGASLKAEDQELTTEKFIEMFDKKQSEWKPKIGERVLVWDWDWNESEAIVETDFKTKVVELIEAKIENYEYLVKDALEGESYGTANDFQMQQKECIELLKYIKEL
jgi:hypothetical protein